MRCMVEDAMARKVVYNAQEVLLAIKKGHDQLQRTVEGSHCAESIVSIGNGASGAHAPSLSLDEDDVDDWEARDDSSEDVDSWESRA
ncbi:hypothetical protein SARC_05212 [Sphaeroforma arctica JP610]|uniref:Uncharacterized protein n=1 Tax=Sphaeroforma arctica JP610 TaxID=667725 RepID=A0A0L0G069_9EUKA|nr:hypothetical protein SARC_05212 [Sphaeroforma arctica JP610]KNC82512.1 hypothetical protein SARC_05212 [Sphaeroforma arctica JP610]|eukprot:XP_014156414.1 hypothetical protein SARC_05212 [Sphaeroforma arctica JP610]